MDIPNVMKMNKFSYLRIWEIRIVDIWISSTKIKPCSLEIIYNALLFVAQSMFFVSFHIQGLHILASILSAFRYLARVDWGDNFSFCLLWHLRPRRKQERFMRYRSSSGRNQTLRPGGTVYGPSKSRRGDVGFSLSHRDLGNQIEWRIGSNQLLNVELGVVGNETPNAEEGVGGEYQAVDRGERLAEGMVEWIEGAGRGQRSRARALSEWTGYRHCEAVKGTTDWRRKESRSWANHDRLFGLLRRLKLSFNLNLCSTSCFKIFSSSQKLSSWSGTRLIRKIISDEQNVNRKFLNVPKYKSKGSPLLFA
jgi:hypothetical protein